MTIRLEKLRKKVSELYEKRNPKRSAGWAQFLYEYHLPVTEKIAAKFAKRYKVNVELSRAGAMLHDIADAVMDRRADGHHQKSLEIAKELLVTSGYTESDVKILVEDALPYHDCRGGIPKTDVGKILSTADAVAHFDYDFVLYHFCAPFKEGFTFEDAKKRALRKLDKDYKIKMLYPEVKKEMKDRYSALKKLFSGK